MASDSCRSPVICCRLPLKRSSQSALEVDLVRDFHVGEETALTKRCCNDLVAVLELGQNYSEMEQDLAGLGMMLIVHVGRFQEIARLGHHQCIEIEFDQLQAGQKKSHIFAKVSKVLVTRVKSAADIVNLEKQRDAAQCNARSFHGGSRCDERGGQDLLARDSRATGNPFDAQRERLRARRPGEAAHAAALEAASRCKRV